MPKILTFDSEQEWLDKRKTIITGSDITAIMGINPYKSAIDVWMDKTGKVIKQELSEDQVDNFERGHWYEKPLLDWFVNKNINSYYIHNKNNDIYLSDKNENFGCTPDACINLKSVAEIKSTSLTNIDNIKNSWYLQLLFNAGILESEEMFLIWIDGRHKRSFERFEFDKELSEEIFNCAEQFWNKQVIADIPPEPKTSSDMLKIWNKHTIGETVIADNDDFGNYIKLCSIKQEIKKLEENKLELEEKLKLKIKTAEGMTDEFNHILCTWKSQDRNQFLTEKFKKEQSELYSEYCEKKTIRVFLPKS